MSSAPSCPMHGVACSTAYVKLGCRCPECRAWQSTRRRNQRASTLAPVAPLSTPQSARIGWPDGDESPVYDPDEWDDEADDSDDFDDFDDDERDAHGADPDAEEDAASSAGVGSFLAIGAGLVGLGALAAAARRRNGAGAALPAQAATTHSAGRSRWKDLLRRLVQPTTDEAGRTARRPEWRAELMRAQAPPGAMALPYPQAARARQPGPCLYVEASRHRAVRDSDASCPHALALPFGAPLPTVARCGRCRVVRIVLGGAHLGSTPLNAVRAGPAARADLEALARAGYQVAP